MNIHEKYIKRCIEIGKNGLGTTAPNPMVGCVIVHGDLIIGEGFTSAYGGPHAEINAINSVKDKSLLEESTLYVTLEPCAHYGKTPPCANTIIDFHIPKVVIGTLDTYSEVAGRGIEKLKAAGCEVIVGILEDEVKAHHQRFFTFHNKKRPYIILKWAESADSFLAPETKDEQKPVWITNKFSRQLVHKWRAEEQAILVGTTTVIADNPSLTARDWTGHHPVRIVLDQHSRLPEGAAIFDGRAKTLVINGDQNSKVKLYNKSKPEHNTPHEFETINWNSKQHIAEQICTILYNHHINSVIIEGGRQTLQTFVDEALWDEARVFTGEVNFRQGTKAPTFNGRLIKKTYILNDTLKIYKND